MDRLEKIEKSLPLLDEHLERMEANVHMRFSLAIGIILVDAYQFILWLVVVPKIVGGFISAWYFIFFIYGIFLHACTCACVYPAFFESCKTSTRGHKYSPAQNQIFKIRFFHFVTFQALKYIQKNVNFKNTKFKIFLILQK